jgi:hypothetical protein
MVRGVEPTNFFEPSKRVLNAIKRLVEGFIKVNLRA